MFPAAREGDRTTHDNLAPSGVIGEPVTGACGHGAVRIEHQPAAHVMCRAGCGGTTSGGQAHPPPPGWQALPVVLGAPTVFIHSMNAARWSPSGDLAACGAFLGDVLAEAGRTVFIGGPANTVSPESMALAWSLIRFEGQGDLTDSVLVAQQLAKFPPHLLQEMKNKGTKVVACRGSVTDYDKDLKGQKPRGWKPGDTWDKVPGAYLPDSNEVVIATTGHPDNPHVPVAGEGHGSSNLVLHEAAHGLDHSGKPQHSTESDFNKAKNADAGKLSSYERQPGEAGQEESYAESAARYYGDDPKDAKDHPHLHDYWNNDPLAPKP